MQYTGRYLSPLGGIFLASDGDALTGLWFDGQKYFARTLEKAHEEMETPAFAAARRWLDIYFSGGKPGFDVPIRPAGTPFQIRVWRILRSVPYGGTISYGGIAARLAAESGGGMISARAVGGAVGRNAISVIVPCHRVVGADGGLTGYAGGIPRKIALLRLEGGRREDFSAPEKNAAP